MKTTVELSDALLHEAKKRAAREGISLRSLLEEALRRELERRSSEQPARRLPLLPPLRPAVQFPLSAAEFTAAAYGDRA